jgi:hypothetical protein
VAIVGIFLKTGKSSVDDKKESHAEQGRKVEKIGKPCDQGVPASW